MNLNISRSRKFLKEPQNIRWKFCLIINVLLHAQANGVIAAYNKIMRAQRGEVEVVVTTAKELRLEISILIRY